MCVRERERLRWVFVQPGRLYNPSTGAGIKCMYVFMFACIDVCMYVCTYVCVCMYVCMYKCMCVV